MPFQKRKEDLENIYEDENKKHEEKPQEPLIKEEPVVPDMVQTNYSKLPPLMQKIYRGNAGAAKLVGKTSQPPVDRADATFKSILFVLCEMHTVLCEIKDVLKK